MKLIPHRVVVKRDVSPLDVVVLHCTDSKTQISNCFLRSLISFYFTVSFNLINSTLPAVSHEPVYRVCSDGCYSWLCAANNGFMCQNFSIIHVETKLGDNDVALC